MSKDRRKLLHIHSSVSDKQPTPDSIEYGELAVNNSKGNAFISTKNSDGEVVRFSEDETIVNWMEMKEVFPYEGYVRGSDNTVSGVTEEDLLANKSNIIIKLNQVVAENTEYDEKVNGAKDIYENPINPIGEGGYKDGAGIAIDMSQYAMQGANPSFSSVTTNCHAMLNGTTEIKGSDDCGSKLDINVNEIEASANTINNIADTSIINSTDLFEISENTNGGSVNVNTTNVNVSANTTNIESCEKVKTKTNDFEIVECEDGGQLLVNITNVEVSASSTNVKSCDDIKAETNKFEIVECEENGEFIVDTTNVEVSADTANIKACDSFKVDTNNFELKECESGNGNAIIDTANVNISANTTNIKSCEEIVNETDKFEIKECNDGGQIVIDSTSVNISSNTTDINSCEAVNTFTNKFNVSKCGDSGEVIFNTSNVNISADTTKVDSCQSLITNTDEFRVNQCNDGNVIFNTTNVSTSANTVDVNACEKIELKSDDIELTQCGEEGIVKIDSNKTNIKSCEEIKLESANIVLTDGDCGDGEITISVDKLCLVGESKINVYGDETNVGLDCADEQIASDTNIYGKNTLISTNINLSGTSSEGDINIFADNNIGIQGSGVTTIAGDSNVYILSNEDICEEANSGATLFGQTNTKIGVSCDGNSVSENTTIKGSGVTINGTDINIEGVGTDISSCEKVNVFTNDFKVAECSSGGNVTIKTSDINASANTVSVKACDKVSTETNEFEIVSCGGLDSKVLISTNSTNISSCSGISATTNDLVIGSCDENAGNAHIEFNNIDVDSCGHNYINTNDFKVTKCDEGNGIVAIVTNNTDIVSCDGVSATTDNFIVTECTDGEGKVEIDTTYINVSANTSDIESCELVNIKTNNLNITECEGENSGITTIKSCGGISAVTDNFVVNSCGSGGSTTIKSCDEVKIESKNIILTDGDCGTGEMTIEVNDLCLAGEEKVNLYGKETNVGLDCNCESGATIAEKTRVFGQGIIITNDENCNALATSGNVQINASETIIEEAKNIFSNAQGDGTDGTNMMFASNYAEMYAGDVDPQTMSGSGAVIKIDKNGKLNELASDSIEEIAINSIVESASNISNFASSNICYEAESAATFYGALNTNIGVTCDNTASASTTNVRGNKVIVHAAVTNLGLSAKEDIIESSERDILITANDNICEQAGDTAAFYGRQETRIGANCQGDVTNTLVIEGNNTCVNGEERATVFGATYSDLGINCDADNIATNTRVSGISVDIGGIMQTNVVSFLTTNISGGSYVNINSEEVDVNGNGVNISGDTVNIEANDEIFGNANNISLFASENLCESGDNVSIFANTNLHIGGQDCNTTGGSGTIVIERRPNYLTSISSTTVDLALDEVYNRSKVYMTYSPNPSGDSGETLITYTLWQDSGTTSERKIGEINLPKDHLIKDTRVVYGTVVTDPNTGEQSFTTCSTQSVDCHWYIEMVWHTWDESHEDKKTYLPADSLVKDIASKNDDANRGVKVDVWYDSTSGMNLVSADTTIRVAHGNDFTPFLKSNAEHLISSYTLTVKENGSLIGRFDPFSDDSEINVTVPTCVSDIGRATLSYQYLASNDSFTDKTSGIYDPGSGCSTTALNTIYIPTSFDNLAEYNGNCYQLSHDICMTSNTIVANSFYNSSDLRLKENINSIDDNTVNKVNSVDFKSFNFKDDETKTKTYGVIAQDVVKAGLNEIVHHNENGTLSVDYISLLILKMQSLENEVKLLREELKNK